MNLSTPGLPVHHQLLESPQTHVHWVSDAVQPCHPLSPPSSLALDLSQHQGLFQWVGSSYQVTKVLEPQLQHQSFQWIFRVDFLRIPLGSFRFDILDVQRTLKSLLQPHSLKASILWLQLILRTVGVMKTCFLKNCFLEQPSLYFLFSCFIGNSYDNGDTTVCMAFFFFLQSLSCRQAWSSSLLVLIHGL